METLTGKFEVTVIVTGLDVAGLPVLHGSLDVSTHVTTSPSAGAYVNVLLLVPELTPSTFHW
jgi:hypothetical protein